MINHRQIFALFMVLVTMLLIVTTISGAFADTFTVSYTTYDTTYEKILGMYLKVINAYGSKNVGRHDLFNDSIYYTAASPEDGAKSIIRATKKAIGYCLWDINQDGIDELLIGSDGGWIHEIFTVDNHKVRELIKAGYYGMASSVYSCSLLDNGMLFRHAHDGPADFYELWEMNGTGPLDFVEGYYSDHEIGANETGDPVIRAWFRLRKPFRNYQKRSTERIDRSAGESWLRKQESGTRQLRFVPFSVFEKFPDDPWNIAMLAVNGSTSSSAKVNIRKEADTASKLVPTKAVGTYVRVLAKEGDFYKITFDNKIGYIQQEYLLPLTYKIPIEDYQRIHQEETTAEMQTADPSPESDEHYPISGTTKKANVNIREKTEKKSKLIATIKKKGTPITIKGESTDKDGVIWYIVEYDEKEGFIRNDFIEIDQISSTSNGELYGLVTKKLATRSGPSPRAEDTGTYSVKGKWLRVYSRAYDPIENAWWVKCDVSYHGEIRTLWAWYTRFDSKTLPLESIPIDENY